MKRYMPFIIFIVIILLDQGSKALVRDYFNPVETLPFYEQTAQVLEACGLGGVDITVRLPRPPAIPILGNFFWINFHENTGVAFGLLNSLSPNTTRPLFALVALLALAFIIFFYRSLPKGKLLPRVSLIFIMAGAIGNLIDRIIIGRVTDFFDLAVRTPESYKNIWPIFNVADSFIVCGVILLFILMLFEKKAPAAAEEDKAQEEEKSAS